MQFIEVAISFAAAAVLMVLHEFPKAFLYLFTTTIEGRRQPLKRIFCLQNYIDPIGMILSIVSYAGFSKPYMFRIQNPKKNLLLGITGFLTLGGIFVGAVSVLKYGYQLSELKVSGTDGLHIAMQLFWIYMAVFSVSMFIVNLFPVSVFDMGLLIAGISARHYLGVIKNDIWIKIVLIFAIAVGVVRYFSFGLIRVLLASG